MFFVALPRLILETFLDFLYFPLWWYTLGAFKSIKWCLSLVAVGNGHFAPGLWLNNIFVPMYGQYDIEGRVISFVMRLFQIVVRFIALFIWVIACLILFLIWLSLPALVLYGFLSLK